MKSCGGWGGGEQERGEGKKWTRRRRNEPVHSSAMDSLGLIFRKHQDKFDENDEEIRVLFEEKHQQHKAYICDISSVSGKTVYSNICKTVQTRLRDMQKIPSQAKWLMKSSPLQTERI